MPDLKVLTIENQIPRRKADIVMTLFEGNPRLTNKFADGPIFVSGSERVVQDVTKGILTEKGSDFLAPNYGTTVPNLIGSRRLADISDQLTNEIQFLLGYLGQFNINEPQSEQIAELTKLEAQEEGGTVSVSLSVTTATGQISTVGVS